MSKILDAMKAKMPKMPDISKMQALASTQSTMMKTQIVELQKQSNYLERWAIAQEAIVEYLDSISTSLEILAKK